MNLNPQELGRRAEQMVRELAPISAEPDRLVRLFLSPQHRQAADVVARWMREAGMTVTEDALGTLRGRAGPGKRLLLGSHIDSVIDAGNYDGPLGVIVGILTVAHFHKLGWPLPFGIDVLAFGDEEGSRFPSTLSSSSAVAGIFEHHTLTEVDSNGVTIADALRAFGKNPADIDKAKYNPDDVLAYVETHIEQGPALEAANEPLGVVVGIVGQSRLRIVVTGEAGHAGTVPMPMRRDALAGAAEMVLFVETLAREHAGDAMVATVGKIDAQPGATNIIPGVVTFTLDLRCMDDAVREAAVARFGREVAAIAQRRKLEAVIEPFHDVVATPCDPKLQDGLAKAIESLGHTPLRLPSGAGHDAQAMAKLCPAAMMFVRCKGGISHNPAEFTSEADMGEAVAAMIRFVENYKTSIE